jgi:hypothetical protein
MRYEQRINNQTHIIETCILVDGDRHLRIHRVQLAAGATGISAFEGAAPLGFPPGGEIRAGRSANPMRSEASHANRVVTIQGWQGYSRAGFPSAWKNNDTLNSVYGKYVLPHLLVNALEPDHLLISTATTSMANLLENDDDDLPNVQWQNDDRITISWRRFHHRRSGKACHLVKVRHQPIRH